MRSYPRNSPEAAARIVALVLISDGNVCQSEVDALQHLQIEPTLGLPAGGFPQVVHTLCEDLLLASYGTATLVCGVDDDTLASLLAEVSDPRLQGQVLQFIAAATSADEHLADGEARIVEAARRLWRIAPQPQPALAA